ncbi:MAG: hypothetical protein ABJB40_10485 [Acidobacteriota bacterium]
MRRLHLILGLLLFIVFVVTGRYMRVDFPDKDLMPQDLRLLMRSRHIYILFNGLIYLVLGVYLQVRPQTWRRIFQYLGSVLLVLSSVLLVWGFVFETYVTQHFSALSFFGIIASLAGVGFHLIGGLGHYRDQ